MGSFTATNAIKNYWLHLHTELTCKTLFKNRHQYRVLPLRMFQKQGKSVHGSSSRQSSRRCTANVLFPETYGKFAQVYIMRGEADGWQYIHLLLSDNFPNTTDLIPELPK